MIIFTQHSLIKLSQRNISKEIVKKVVKSPDFTFKSYSNREIAYKGFKKLYLKVIFRKENKNIIIITQYWTKGLN
ncbi:DUF4258 domain-containing protein [Patescibacteria group bacterium]|nr:DUF4258 domain-containing protein [Patescibacteria group bacterium]